MHGSAQKVSRFPKPRSVTSLLPVHRQILDHLATAFTAVRDLDEARCIVERIEIAGDTATVILSRGPQPGIVGGQHEIIRREGEQRVRMVRATYQGVTLEWRAPEYQNAAASDLTDKHENQERN